MPISIEKAHYDSEKEMRGHCCERTQKEGIPAVYPSERNILRGGKAERNKGRINHAVKKTAEIFILSCDQKEQQEFEKLFDQSHAEKRAERVVREHRGSICKRSDAAERKGDFIRKKLIKKPGDKTLSEICGNINRRAGSEKNRQKRGGLFFDPILVVNVKAQQ